MFDIGWSELLIIGLVALIVVGPKDLPVMFRRIGQWVGRMRTMARDFQRAMDDAADQAGVNEIKKGIQQASNPVGSVLDDAASSLKNFQNEVTGDREIKKVDAAAEFAKRQKMVEDANAAAESWTAPEDEAVDVATAAAPAVKKPAVKKTPAKKKPAAKKTPPKKAPAKKAAS
ncbi:MAG: Sec-independent protein translocase protein TatB [Pseudomonadota bacterium]